MSDEDLQEIKEGQDLCYKCDERFFPGYHCKRKELNVLVFQNQEEDDKEEMLSMEEKETKTEGRARIMGIGKRMKCFNILDRYHLIGAFRGGYCCLHSW